MKKNIAIVILSLAVIFFALYGFIKANEAERNLIVAMEQRALAEKNAEEARVASELAISRAAEAEEARAELNACLSNKP